MKGPVLKPNAVLVKRCFDMIVSFLGLLLSGWLIILAWILASLDTRANGFFMQQRVGLNGRLFRVVKIRTMRIDDEINTTVTTTADARITRLGRVMRRMKIDELPQLWNVLKGEMSFVGPRPDVPEVVSVLQGAQEAVLSVRPGITGPASLKYRNEEELLSRVADPERYNREVIFPDKVRLNLDYISRWSLASDIRYILATIFGTHFLSNHDQQQVSSLAELHSTRG